MCFNWKKSLTYLSKPKLERIWSEFCSLQLVQMVCQIESTLEPHSDQIHWLSKVPCSFLGLAICANETHNIVLPNSKIWFFLELDTFLKLVTVWTRGYPTGIKLLQNSSRILEILANICISICQTLHCKTFCMHLLLLQSEMNKSWNQNKFFLQYFHKF